MGWSSPGWVMDHAGVRDLEGSALPVHRGKAIALGSTCDRGAAAHLAHGQIMLGWLGGPGR